MSSSNDNSRLIFKKNLKRFLEKQKNKKNQESKINHKKESNVKLPPKHMDTFNNQTNIPAWAKDLVAGSILNDQTIATPYFMTPKTSMNQPSS